MSSLERQIQDVLETVNAFASHTDSQLVELRKDVGVLKSDVGVLKTDVGVLKANGNSLWSIVNKMSSEMALMRSEMATKTYLDEKIADLRGDLMLIARRGNRKLETVVEALQTEGVLPAKVAERILLMEPFPQR